MSSITTCNSDVAMTGIQQFYEGQNVFITGGTGFLGKLLIEKLLRSCPDLGCIYLLIRPKNGKDINDRIDEIVSDPLFIKLKKQQPQFRDRIIGIHGDCGLPELGISHSDYAHLCQEISIVFHVAAQVNFNKEKMKLAVMVNIRGTRDVLRMCKQMIKLKACMYVSTAYSNCIRSSTIEERFYDPPFNGETLISLVEDMDDTSIYTLSLKILGEWPNPYIFTKAIAEDMVRQEGNDLPIGVFRPVTVIPTYLEPLQGWIDNMYGPTGVTVFANMGLLHTFYIDDNIRADVVPGDVTVNALIASAWDVYERKKNDPGIVENKNDGRKSDNLIPIYNHSSKDNSLTWREFRSKFINNSHNMPFIHAVWYYSFCATKSKLKYKFYVYTLHLLPALIIDTLRICMGKQARVLGMYKKFHKFMKELEYFADKEWHFPNDNIVKLIQMMDIRDQEIFPFDMKDVDWDIYRQNYIRGIRTYLMKDPLETLPQARNRELNLFLVHKGLKILFICGILRLCWRWLPEFFSTLMYLKTICM